MVLEALTTPERAEKKPSDLFFIGIMYAALAVFLAVWVFREESSMIMILLTVIACIPLLYNTMRYEEEKDVLISSERLLLREHGHALSFFMWLFVGFVIAYSLAYIFLPVDMVSDLFRAQLNTIKSINSNTVAGQLHSSLNAQLFMQILGNNVKVLIFCIFFSFFYGAGSIFILTWNASVISAAIGTFFRNNLSSTASSLGFSTLAAYFSTFSLSLLRYFIHGLPEILGYFIGGLAGGIISVAVIRHDFGSKLFKHIMRDSFSLIVLAIFVLFIAAVLEVYVTPLFF